MYNLDISARGRLQELRTARGLSIRDISLRTGLGRATIQRAHDCATADEVVQVHPTTLRKLAELYGVSIPHVVNGLEATETTSRSRFSAVGGVLLLAALGSVILALPRLREAWRNRGADPAGSTVIVGGGTRQVQVTNSSSGRLLYERKFMSEVDLRALTPWHSSVLVAYREVEDECCRIEVWDFETGRLRWDNMICREIFEPVYGDVAAESGVKAWDARFVDLGGDGEPEVVVLIRQITHYPCLIRVYGAQGEILGDYFHRGYVYDVAVKDLDDDGREEIVLGGTSNTSNGAMIAILDEDHLDGMVDATGEASPGFDHSLVRVVLPPFSSQAMRLLNLDRLRAGGFVISRHGDGGATRLRCTVGDARTPIFLTTDSDLRPVSFSFHEHLRNKAEVWIDRGELEPGFGTRSHVMSWLNHHLRFEEGALVESPVLEPEAVSSTR